MQGISVLKDRGKDKDCLIIGGGTSVLDFDFMRTRKLDTIAVNDSFPENAKIDYCMYNDACFLPVYKAKRLWERCGEVIANAKSYYDGAKYYYKDSDLPPSVDDDDTGLKAIILAKDVMRYERIFLIGFDFYTLDKEGNIQENVEIDITKPVDHSNYRSHFHGDPVGANEKYTCEMNLTNHINRLSVFLKRYKKIKNIQGVYNCNKDSALRLFPHAMPWAVKIIA